MPSSLPPVVAPEAPATSSSMLDEFQSRLGGLAILVDRATEQMEAALDDLRNSGRLPSHHLIVALGESHRQLGRLRRDLLVAASSHGLKIRPSWKLAGVRELDEFLGSLRDVIQSQAESRVATSPAAPTAPSRIEETPESPQPAPPMAVVPIPLPEPSPDPGRVAASEVLEQPAPEETVLPSLVEPASPLSRAADGVSPIDELAGSVETTQAENDVPSLVEASLDALAPAPRETDDREPAGEEIPDLVAEDYTPTFTVRDALQTLERASRLSLRDGTSLPELSLYHDLAESLRRSIADRDMDFAPETLAALAEGTHPIAQLVNAVDGSEELNDAQWADLHATVSQEFGRPLAVAMARGRLVLEPTNPS